MSILAGAALGLAGAAIQQQFTDYNREQDANINESMQARNFLQAQELQRLAPVNTKLGMVAAGLNPNAVNVSSSPNSSASAPLATHASPDVDLSADNNLMADSRLKNAEAKKIELQNDQIVAENESSLENYLKQGNSIAQMYHNRGWHDQANAIEEDMNALSELKANGKLTFNVGNLKGAVNAFTTIQAMQERLTNSLDQMLKTETNYKMLINGASYSLSKMPKLQREMLEKQISTQMATTSLLISQKNLTDEQKNELLMMEDKIGAEIAMLEEQGKLTKVEAEQIRNADWKSLLADGEFREAMIAQADEKSKILLNQLGSVAGAVVNARTGGKIAESVGNLKQTKGNDQRTTSTYHYDSNSKLKGYDVQQTSGHRSTLGRSVPNIENDLTW